MFDSTSASMSLNFTRGGFISQDPRSRMSNSFMLAGVPNGEGPMWDGLASLSFLVDNPSDSARVGPPPGTYNSASFSDGSKLIRYSPDMVVSTNSTSMLSPTSSI